MMDAAERFAASERDRWMLPDAARWVRPDAARFLAPGTRTIDAFPALDRKFNPNQPRVPAGNPDGGQWTDGGGGGNGGGGYNDPRVISDAYPDAISPGQQYAQNRRRGGTTVSINGQPFELSPAQAARLTIARVRAERAIARVRKVQSDWRPPPSVYQTPEGLIRAYEADAAAAQARASELSNRRALPGPYAGESIKARGPGRNFTATERREINRIGRETGCHTCGTFDPGTKLGNFIPDHQIPSALNSSGKAQRLYPHCLSCSVRQGGFVGGLRRR